MRKLDVRLVEKQHGARRQPPRDGLDGVARCQQARRVGGTRQEHHARGGRDGDQRLFEWQIEVRPGPDADDPRAHNLGARGEQRVGRLDDDGLGGRAVLVALQPRHRRGVDALVEAVGDQEFVFPDTEPVGTRAIGLAVVRIGRGLGGRDGVHRLERRRRAAGGVLVQVQPKARAALGRAFVQVAHRQRSRMESAWACRPSASASAMMVGARARSPCSVRCWREVDAHEIRGRQSAAEPRGAGGRQHVIRSGRVVARRLRAPGADERRPRPDARRGLRLVADEVFGREPVRQRHGLGARSGPRRWRRGGRATRAPDPSAGTRARQFAPDRLRQRAAAS